MTGLRQDGVPRTLAGTFQICSEQHGRTSEHWHPIRSKLSALLTTEALDPDVLAAAISEAMAHVPWPGERGTITFGGLTYRAAGKAIADAYLRARAGEPSEPGGGAGET